MSAHLKSLYKYILKYGYCVDNIKEPNNPRPHTYVVTLNGPYRHFKQILLFDQEFYIRSRYDGRFDK